MPMRLGCTGKKIPESGVLNRAELKAMSDERPPKRLCSSDVRKMIESWADAEEYGIISENSDSDPISHVDLDLD